MGIRTLALSDRRRSQDRVHEEVQFSELNLMRKFNMLVPIEVPKGQFLVHPKLRLGAQ